VVRTIVLDGALERIAEDPSDEANRRDDDVEQQGQDHPCVDVTERCGGSHPSPLHRTETARHDCRRDDEQGSQDLKHARCELMAAEPAEQADDYGARAVVLRSSVIEPEFVDLAE